MQNKIRLENWIFDVVVFWEFRNLYLMGIFLGCALVEIFIFPLFFTDEISSQVTLYMDSPW
jgi:hypothetical protein